MSKMKYILREQLDIVHWLNFECALFEFCFSDLESHLTVFVIENLSTVFFIGSVQKKNDLKQPCKV